MKASFSKTLIAASLSLMIPGAALAADDDIQELKQEIAMLKKQLNHVEKRLEKEELRSRPVAARAPAALATGLNSTGSAFMAKYADKIQYKASPKSPSDYGYHSQDASAQLTGYGIFNFNSTEHAHSYFNVMFYPEMIFRYKDLFAWDSLLYFYVDTLGATQTRLTYSYASWFVTPHFTLAGGKFFDPEGKFANTYYLPWLNKLPTYPVGFGFNAATPQADIGLQAHGDVPLSESAKVTYALFVVNGPEANVANNVISSIASNGTASDVDGHKVWGGRLAYLPFPELEMGVSAAIGQIGLYNANGKLIQTSRDYHSLGADVTYTHNQFSLLGEYMQQFVGRNTNNVFPAAARWSAWYAQAGYRFFANWEGVMRYGSYSTPDPNNKQRQVDLGVDYWFSPTIVAKLDYEFNSGRAGTAANANILCAQFAYGFA